MQIASMVSTLARRRFTWLIPFQLVKVAQLQEIAGAHVQVAVMEVDFADGAVWRPDPDPRLPTGNPTAPFSPSLLKADTSICSSAAAILEILRSIKGAQTAKTSVKSEMVKSDEDTIPHLAFKCRLQTDIARCGPDDHSASPSD